MSYLRLLERQRVMERVGAQVMMREMKRREMLRETEDRVMRDDENRDRDRSFLETASKLQQDESSEASELDFRNGPCCAACPVPAKRN